MVSFNPRSVSLHPINQQINPFSTALIHSLVNSIFHLSSSKITTSQLFQSPYRYHNRRVLCTYYKSGFNLWLKARQFTSAKPLSALKGEEASSIHGYLMKSTKMGEVASSMGEVASSIREVALAKMGRWLLSCKNKLVLNCRHYYRNSSFVLL